MSRQRFRTPCSFIRSSGAVTPSSGSHVGCARLPFGAASSAAGASPASPAENAVVISSLRLISITSFPLRLFLYRGLGSAGVVRERAVVNAHLGIAQQLEREQCLCGASARGAVRHDLLVRGDPL